jgi:RNA polymerase sigma-70 factor (ECF subfamily)
VHESFKKRRVHALLPTAVNTHESQDALLIAEAIAGDLESFETLYRRYSARVYGLCLRLTRHEADAQDCTQETFIRAWRQLGRFRGDSAFGTWLHRIAVNEVLSRRRRASTEQRYLRVVQPETAPSDQEGTIDVEELERAIRQLPDRARDVLVLHKIYGYTHEETGKMLDIAAGTCKAQVHRALKLVIRSLRTAPLDPAKREESGGGLR